MAARRALAITAIALLWAGVAQSETRSPHDPANCVEALSKVLTEISAQHTILRSPKQDWLILQSAEYQVSDQKLAKISTETLRGFFAPLASICEGNTKQH